MAKLFQTSLFGYSKRNVNEYLSRLNEEFSQKMLEKEHAHKKELQALQAEVEQLTKENAQLQAARCEVADALINARDYAAVLKRQAEEDDQKQRSRNTARQEAELGRIQAVAKHISDLQQTVRSVLESMDRELVRYRTECRRLQMEANRQDGASDAEKVQKEGESCTSEAR